MYIEPKEVCLKNGQKVILKSPDISDAAMLLEHMRRTSEETEFMSRYPEEILVPVEAEKRFLQTIKLDEQNFMLAAYIDGRMVGNAGVTRVNDNFKYRHRANLGISLREEACNLGLGTLMIKEILDIVKLTGIVQLELSVFADNVRARHLYEKLGFEQVGTIPWAYRLKDGSYHDEVQMVYRVKEWEYILENRLEGDK